MLLVNAALVSRAGWGWAEGEGPTRRLDPGAVAEDRAPEENCSDTPEGCKAQPMKGEGHESITLRISSTLCTKCKHAPRAYKAGCTTDASAARMCGGVAAATGTSIQTPSALTQLTLGNPGFEHLNIKRAPTCTAN